MPTLRAGTTPQLWISGSEDYEAPSAETGRRIKSLIADGRPFTFALYPGAEHGMTLFEKAKDGKRVDTRYAPGYFGHDPAISRCDGQLRGSYGDADTPRARRRDSFLTAAVARCATRENILSRVEIGKKLREFFPQRCDEAPCGSVTMFFSGAATLRIKSARTSARSLTFVNHCPCVPQRGAREARWGKRPAKRKSLCFNGIRGRAAVPPLLLKKIRRENAYVSTAWRKRRPLFIFPLLIAAVIAAVTGEMPATSGARNHSAPTWRRAL